ncbi:hypothetical protein HMPREF1870_02566 [Bacteroidales bacterium KA00344]|nr:hypothetical protein HMPREF1870_02566 [Bacteroidales bacterium KA00344]
MSQNINVKISAYSLHYVLQMFLLKANKQVSRWLESDFNNKKKVIDENTFLFNILIKEGLTEKTKVSNITIFIYKRP